MYYRMIGPSKIYHEMVHSQKFKLPMGEQDLIYEGFVLFDGGASRT